MEKTKKIILFLTMLICGSVISQTGTKKEEQKNTVRIDTITALYIANDLIDGDVCKAERVLLRENIEQYKQAIKDRDSVIALLEQKIVNLEIRSQKLEEKVEKKDDEITLVKKQADKKWSVGLVGGYGLNLNSNPSLGAFIGIGITRPIFKF